MKEPEPIYSEEEIEAVLEKLRDPENRFIPDHIKVLDFNRMVKSHLSMIRANITKDICIPYFERLKKFVK